MGSVGLSLEALRDSGRVLAGSGMFCEALEGLGDVWNGLVLENAGKLLRSWPTQSIQFYMTGFGSFCSSTTSEVFEALHGLLLESDAPRGGGLWNALRGFILLWNALSVSGVLFWPALHCAPPYGWSC